MAMRWRSPPESVRPRSPMMVSYPSGSFWMKSWARAALGGCDHGAVGNVRLSVGDVVAHGVVEQDGVLGDDADLPPQRGQRDVAHVVAVDQDAAAAHVEEARDQVHQRALAGAARAHDGQHLALLHLQVDVAQTLRGRLRHWRRR